MDAANGILSCEGYLVLDEDPELWIQRNPSHCLSVRRFKLDYLGEFTELTHLSILNTTVTQLPDIPPSLRKLKVIDLYGCSKLQELPPNLGDLNTLTSLSLRGCRSIKSLPGSLGKLSNLTDLFISHCYNLEELPENFGELESLTHFTLQYCGSIKLLPSSVAELPKLTTLTIRDCYALKELPAYIGELKSLTNVFIQSCRFQNDCPLNLKLVGLNMKDCCSIQVLPIGFSNLKHLYLPLCIDREERLANLKYCVSLRHLKFWDCLFHNPKEFPLNVDKLPQLSLLDIQDTRIKWLPSSISKLSKLRLLLLPYGFLLDTLPYDLDESLVISVKDTHVRKTWKELKTEMEIISSHTVGEMAVDPSEYLSLTGDPAPWIQNKSTSLSRVRILDLDLRGNRAGNIIDSIAELAELTHLVISGGSLRQLPQTFTRISHISLHECEFECKSGFDSLGKLSTLKSLDLYYPGLKILPAHVDVPVSLIHLSLHLGHINFTPLLDSMTKLSNLKALHLFRFEQFDSLPKNLNLEKLKLVDCDVTNIKSFSSGLRHVEILHTKGMCSLKCSKLGTYINQLVDVETLSVTCHRIKLLYSVAGLHNVQELQLKDCFSIKQLPPNLDVMVNLCTLNLSGTRIKSLPHSILKLPNLHCLILPKCFQPGSLPLEIRNQPLVSFDNTDDKYYEDMGYYDSDHETSDEADDNTTNTIESEEGSNYQQNISSHQLLDQPDATPVFKDYNFDGRHSSNINTNSHACNQEMPENMICLNEVLKESEKGITAEQQSSPKQLLNLPDSILDSNSVGSSDLIGKNNHRAISRSQNQEREPISLGDCDKMITDVSSNFQKTVSFVKNSQRAVQNGQMDIMNLETELEITLLNHHNSSCDKTDVSHSGNSLNSLEENKKRKKPRGKRLEFTLEEIRSLVYQGMTVFEAAQELGVSESTLKRRCTEFEIKERPSSRHHHTTPDVVMQRGFTKLTIRAQKEPPITSQRSHQQGQDHLNGYKEHSLLTTGASWSNFIVKACNDENGDIAKFQFSSSSNIDQLKDEIGKRLELEVGKFKIRYKDADDELVLVTFISDLQDALSLSKSNVVRLSVISKT